MAEDPEPLLRVHDLHTHFRTDDGVVKAVDGLSFEVRPREVVAVVGESGSGKSVAMLSIMRLVPEPAGFHPRGEIWFEGEDLVRASDARMRSIRGNRISMIFQDPMTSLNPTLTIGRQLTEVLELHQGLSPREASARAAAMLTRVGIADAESRLRGYPHELSGGMRQRVMIAMMLLCQPKLLIADEPTTALDVTIQAQILDLMRDLQKDLGTSIVLITHDLGVVAGMADRIVVMYAGRAVESGTATEIFKSPRHPYTQGLLRCIPRLDRDVDQPLEPIRGLPPDLSALPTGCAFHPRCPVAEPRCAEREPPLVTLGASARYARCWLLEESAS